MAQHGDHLQLALNRQCGDFGNEIVQLLGSTDHTDRINGPTGWLQELFASPNADPSFKSSDSSAASPHRHLAY
jgi:hypothetical protein